MKIKVYVNFILIKSLGTLGTVRVDITESNIAACNGMLVDTLLENKISECFNFLQSYRFLA